MTNTPINMSDVEDFIFHFRAYSIQNEADCQATLADFQFSRELIDAIIELKIKVLKEIVDTNQLQLTQFAFEFLVQSLTKNNVNLFSNIINYTATNQTIV